MTQTAWLTSGRAWRSSSQKQTEVSRRHRTSVSYDGGAVDLVFPLPDADQQSASASSAKRKHHRRPVARIASVQGCPSGPFRSDYYCFYADRNFGGRRLQFKDCANDATHARQYFATYAFRNEASSWVNTTNNYISVYDYDPGYGGLWTELKDQQSAAVQSSKDNRADYFYSYC